MCKNVLRCIICKVMWKMTKNYWNIKTPYGKSYHLALKSGLQGLLSDWLSFQCFVFEYQQNVKWNCNCLAYFVSTSELSLLKSFSITFVHICDLGYCWCQIMIVVAVCIHRLTYSPLYANNQSVWPNMSRLRLRSNYGEPCGDLRVSSSSYTTAETLTAHGDDVYMNVAVWPLMLKFSARILSFDTQNKLLQC